MSETITHNPTTGEIPPPAVWPTLLYADAPAAVRVLVDVFGFRETFVVRDQENLDVIQHSQLTWPEGGGVMVSSKIDDATPFRQQPAGAAGLYVVTDRPDEIATAVAEAGLEIVRPLGDQERYESRDVSVRDPEGNIWTFGTYRGEPR